MRHGTIAAALMAAAGAWQPAAAQDTVTLKFAHQFPTAHLLWTEAGKILTEAVTEATGGQVQWEVYPSGQLGNDSVGLLKSGIADFAMMPPGYHPDVFPLSGVAELPGYYNSTCESVEKAWPLFQPGGALHEAEYAPNGLRVITITGSPPFKVMTAKTPVNSVAELAGLKMRVTGLAQTESITKMGAVPVNMTSLELYESLSRGTLDGLIYVGVGMPSFNLPDVVKYSVDNAAFGGPIVTWTMSQAGWDRLTPEAQEALTTAGAEMMTHFCAYYDDNENAMIQDFVANHGHTVLHWSDEEVEKFRASYAEVPQIWARQMDERGLPGTEMLELYTASGE